MKEVIKQHNTITEARYKMTALEKNILYLLLGELNDTPQAVYEIKIRKLEKARGVEIRVEEMRQALHQLIKRVLTIFDGKQFLKLNVLATARYNKGRAILEIDKRMHPFFFDLKERFTLVNLKVALSLSSIHSKRFYEMLSQYKDTGVLKVTVEELKKRLGLIDPATEKQEYVEFSMFRTKVLDVAKKELEEKSELSFTYKATKTGRKYTNLVFTIKSKSCDEGPEVVQVVSDRTAQYKALVEEFKLTDRQAKKVMDKIEEKELNKLLYNLKILILDKKIHNRAAYLMRVVKDY